MIQLDSSVATVGDSNVSEQASSPGLGWRIQPGVAAGARAPKGRRGDCNQHPGS